MSNNPKPYRVMWEYEDFADFDTAEEAIAYMKAAKERGDFRPDVKLDLWRREKRALEADGL